MVIPSRSGIMSYLPQELPSSEMDPVVAAQLQELLVRLLALDQILGSVPLQYLHQQQNLDLDIIFSKESNDPILQEVAARYMTLTFNMNNLHWIVDKVPRFELIPATLVIVCRISWQGRIFENMHRQSDINKSRDPTCSEALSLLRKIDRISGTRLRVKINAILRSVPPFRFLSLPAELRLHAYKYILPRQPYLMLRNLEPRRHAIPRSDLTVLRTCRIMHDELMDHFYKDQVIVINAYDIVADNTWMFRVLSLRDRFVIHRMGEAIRSYFKAIEIRILDMEDPNTYRKGKYWESTSGHDEWDWEQFFTQNLEAFPNIQNVTVSFEIEESCLRWWTGWYRSLEDVARFLLSYTPRGMEVRWDFQPSSHPDLQEVGKDNNEQIMDALKEVVAEDAAKWGKIVQTSKSIIKEYIPTRTIERDRY